MSWSKEKIKQQLCMSPCFLLNSYLHWVPRLSQDNFFKKINASALSSPTIFKWSREKVKDRRSPHTIECESRLAEIC